MAGPVELLRVKVVQVEGGKGAVRTAVDADEVEGAVGSGAGAAGEEELMVSNNGGHKGRRMQSFWKG